MKILVIDDHALRRDALQGVMKKLKRGAVVLEASDSRQAMEILVKQVRRAQRLLMLQQCLGLLVWFAFAALLVAALLKK